MMFEHFEALAKEENDPYYQEIAILIHKKLRIFALIFTAEQFREYFTQFNLDTQPLEAIECLLQTNKDLIASLETICSEFQSIIKAKYSEIVKILPHSVLLIYLDQLIQPSESTPRMANLVNSLNMEELNELYYVTALRYFQIFGEIDKAGKILQSLEIKNEASLTAIVKLKLVKICSQNSQKLDYFHIYKTLTLEDLIRSLLQESLIYGLEIRQIIEFIQAQNYQFAKQLQVLFVKWFERVLKMNTLSDIKVFVTKWLKSKAFSNFLEILTLIFNKIVKDFSTVHSLQIFQIYNLIRELASSASEDQNANFQSIVVLVNELHNLLICAQKMRGLKIELKLSFVYQCIDSSRNYETKVEGYKKLMEEVLGKQLLSRNFQVLKLLQSAESTWEEFAKMFQSLGIELGLSNANSTWIHQFILKYCLFHSQPQLIFSLLKQINEEPDTPIINIDHDTISGICLESLIQKFNEAQYLSKEAFQFNIQVLKFLQSFNESDKQVKFELFLNQFIVTMMAQFHKELNPKGVRESMKSVSGFMNNFEGVDINEINYEFILKDLLMPAAELSRGINQQDLLNYFVISLIPKHKDLVLQIVDNYPFANLVFANEAIPKLVESLTKQQIAHLLEKLMHQELVESEVLFKLLEYKQQLKSQYLQTEEDEALTLSQTDFMSPESLCLKLAQLIQAKEATQDEFTARVLRLSLVQTETLETAILAFKKLPLSYSLITNVKRTLYILEDILVVDEVLRRQRYRSLFPPLFEQDYEQKKRALIESCIEKETRAKLITKVLKETLKPDLFSDYAGRLKTIEIESQLTESIKKKDKLLSYFERNDQNPAEFKSYEESEIIDVFLSLAARSTQQGRNSLNLRLIILLMHEKDDKQLKSMLLLHQFLQENSWLAILFCQFREEQSRAKLLALVPERMKADVEIETDKGNHFLSEIADSFLEDKNRIIPLFHLLRRTNFMFLKRALKSLLPHNCLEQIYEIKRNWLE